jgi:hypothetical protein
MASLDQPRSTDHRLAAKGNLHRPDGIGRLPAGTRRAGSAMMKGFTP